MKQTHARRIVAGMLAAASVLSIAKGGAEASLERPAPAPNSDGNYNMLFITVDQEHYFAEGEYPEESNYRARALLAELGVTFEKHYVCANMSTSSRSNIFTGLHLPDTGMSDNTDLPWQTALDEEIPTIGDRMRQAGYYTAIKGKWHMGDATIFDAEAITDLEGYGFSDWNGVDYIGAVQEGYEKDPVIVSETLAWLDDTGKQLNAQGQSFFLNVNLVNPHDIMNYDISGNENTLLTLTGKPEDDLYLKTYSEPIPDSWNFDFTAPDVPDALRIYQSNWSKYAGAIDDPALWKDYQDYYFNCIQDSDNNLSIILDYLIENDMLKNTIIVFTSDHGEMHGSHGLKGKGGVLYENNVHVPLIIVHPEYAGGQRVSALTSHIDLAPTFIDMVSSLTDEQKAELTADLPGKSLLGLMDGSATSVRDGALFCYEMLSLVAVDSIQLDEAGQLSFTFDFTNRGMVRGLITQNYKFVRYFAPLEYNTPTTLEELYAHNDVQLFDLNSDPGELCNLAADPEENGELILALNAELNALIADEIGEDDGTHIAEMLKGLQDHD